MLSTTSDGELYSAAEVVTVALSLTKKMYLLEAEPFLK